MTLNCPNLFLNCLKFSIKILNTYSKFKKYFQSNNLNKIEYKITKFLNSNKQVVFKTYDNTELRFYKNFESMLSFFIKLT